MIFGWYLDPACLAGGPEKKKNCSLNFTGKVDVRAGSRATVAPFSDSSVEKKT
jgi:hypothetical protein